MPGWGISKLKQAAVLLKETKPQIEGYNEEDNSSEKGEAYATEKSGLFKAGTEATAGNFETTCPSLTGREDEDDEQRGEKKEETLDPYPE